VAKAYRRINAAAKRFEGAARLQHIGDNVSKAGFVVAGIGMGAAINRPTPARTAAMGIGAAALATGIGLQVGSRIKTMNYLGRFVGKPRRAMAVAERVKDPYPKKMLEFLGKWNEFNETEKDALQVYFAAQPPTKLQKIFLRRLSEKHGVKLVII